MMVAFVSSFAEIIKYFAHFECDMMTVRNQITALCRTLHFHLRNIGRIRKSVTDNACGKLIHAFVTSRLDVGIANLFNLLDNQLNGVLNRVIIIVDFL